MPRTFWFSAICLAAAVSLDAQTVRGRVVDGATKLPIPMASVSALNSAGRPLDRTAADSAGYFAVELRGAGAYRLRAERVGYRAVTSPDFDLGAREALEVELHMTVMSVNLDPLVITSRAEPPRLTALDRVGFYVREQNSPGLFMRREDIARTRGARLSDVLGTIPGARRATIQGRAGVSLGRSGGTGRACPPAVFLDGMQVVRAEGIDDIVHVAAVEALEVYRGP
ncbi:MAG: carboxypeptidase regulatory-like domain-containing protein, partial [Gemmatimonadetes bacterium]|nr:carboxypeptidase regulatory-like domain-containing protein [Gemmatimonadota bacterium]